MHSLKKEYAKFFAITFTWTWGLLAVPVIMGWNFDRAITKVFFYIAGIAPSVVGIILALAEKDRDYTRNFWRRILSLKQIGVKWHMFIFAYVPVTSISAIWIYSMYTHRLPELQKVRDYIADPLGLLLFAVYTLLFGPIAEEIGWRGYALDHLEKEFGWLKSSIILGLLWFSWHLPMFLIEGTYQNTILRRSVFLFIDFGVGIMAMSIIMGWIYNNNNRSILSGILIHYCTNFFGEILELPEHIMYLRTGVQAVAALLIVFIVKRNTRINNTMTNFKLP